MVVRHAAQDADEDSKKNSKQFYDDLDESKKRRGCALFSCGGCLSVLVLLILAVVVTGASAVAASGALEIPVLSTLFYKSDPLPKRSVEPDRTAKLETLLSSVSKTGSLALTESQITALLQQPSTSGQLILKQGQLAINTAEAELYGQIIPPMVDHPVIVRAYLAPSGSGQVQLTKLVVGYIAVPLRFARTVVRLATGQDIGTTASLSRFGVQSATLGQGTVTIKLDPAKLESAAGDAAQSAASGLQNSLPTAVPESAQ